MLTIIGWVVVVLAGIYFGIFTFFVGFMNLGTYNIGGVPNKWSDKLIALILIGMFLTYAWWVIGLAPFTIALV